LLELRVVSTVSSLSEIKWTTVADALSQ